MLFDDLGMFMLLAYCLALEYLEENRISVQCNLIDTPHYTVSQKNTRGFSRDYRKSARIGRLAHCIRPIDSSRLRRRYIGTFQKKTSLSKTFYQKSVSKTVF